MEHLIAAGDTDAAARQISASAMTMHFRGQTSTVERWLATFDQAVFEKRPPFAVAAAWIHILNGRPAEADRMADIADRTEHHGRPGRWFGLVHLSTRDPACGHGTQRAARCFDQRKACGIPRAAGEPLASHCPVHARLDPPAAGQHPGRGRKLWQGRCGDLARCVATGHGRVWPSAHHWRCAGETSRPLTITSGRQRPCSPRVGTARCSHALLVHAVSARIAIKAGDQERGRESLVRAQLVRPLANHSAPWFSVDALLELCRAYLAVSDPAGAQQTLREAERIIRRRPGLGTLTADLVTARKLSKARRPRWPAHRA